MLSSVVTAVVTAPVLWFVGAVAGVAATTLLREVRVERQVRRIGGRGRSEARLGFEPFVQPDARQEAAQGRPDQRQRCCGNWASCCSWSAQWYGSPPVASGAYGDGV